MKNQTILPDGYNKILDIDLLRNKKLALLVNILSLLTVVLLILAALPFNIFDSFLDLSGNVTYIIKLFVFLVGIIAYLYLHEIVHGIFMKKFGVLKPVYGLTPLYAYAGSKAYFNKKSYVVVALAPLVIWGIVLTVLFFIVPASWYWVVYGIQMMNISGSMGDIYVSVRFSSLPHDILIQDSGVAMTIYAPKAD